MHQTFRVTLSAADGAPMPLQFTPSAARALAAELLTGAAQAEIFACADVCTRAGSEVAAGQPA